MRKLLLLAAFLLLFLAPPVSAKPCNDNWPLHPGSCGQRVADLQWLLAGHQPNAFTKVKPTFKWDPNGAYGARTKSALKAYRYRIGVGNWQTDEVGPYFFQVLKTGHRPTAWVANAAHRLKAPDPGISAEAQKIRLYEQSQIGVLESPLGSNWGHSVSIYQSATGAYHAAWCVSFQQYSFQHVGYGTFASRSAGVFYVVEYGRQRNWLNAKAKVGSLVAFLDGQGHMGFVAKVTAAGFSSIEGNQSNGVHERWHPYFSRRYVFIYLPGVVS